MATVSVLSVQDDQELNTILQNLADPMKTSSQTSFKREFGLLKSKLTPPGLWAFHRNMTPVVQRCCTEKNYWPAAELDFLIQVQCISPENILMVFKTLSERKEVGMLYHALTTQLVGDIPENCLLIALQCFLSVEEEVVQKAVEECQPDVFCTRSEDGASSCPLSTARSAFVDKILDAPYDEVHLISSLKKLPFGLAHDLLKYTLHRMRTSSDPKDADKMLKWQGHIMDAHSTHLVLSKEAHQTLVEISKEQESHVKFVRALSEDLLPLLKLATAKNTDKRSTFTGSYCIETLHL